MNVFSSCAALALPFFPKKKSQNPRRKRQILIFMRPTFGRSCGAEGLTQKAVAVVSSAQPNTWGIPSTQCEGQENMDPNICRRVKFLIGCPVMIIRALRSYIIFLVFWKAVWLPCVQYVRLVILFLLLIPWQFNLNDTPGLPEWWCCIFDVYRPYHIKLEVWSTICFSCLTRCKNFLRPVLAVIH